MYIKYIGLLVKPFVTTYRNSLWGSED